ncbi:MAG: hypothetical protein PF445_03920 [Melioribacteraceae bacterium]|jgi:hypothetical protein|nr:hypothetical protein [Melioribacteraceae bacterium]
MNKEVVHLNNDGLSVSEATEELLDLELEVEDRNDNDIETYSSVARYEWVIPRIKYLKGIIKK